MISDLQQLVDARLGEAGPWHRLVEQWRGAGDSWETIGARLRERTGLPVERLRGYTISRWVKDRAEATAAASR